VRRLILACVLVIAVGSAHAGKPKSRTAAQALAGVGTGVASLLVLGGFMLAPDGQDFDKPLLYAGLAAATVLPSAGEWYAENWLTYGLAARVFGAGLATFALTTQMRTQPCIDAQTSMQTCTNLQGAGFALLGAAAIAFVGGMAYDVEDAGDAVDRWNARHGFTASVVPLVLATPAGSTPGLAIAGHF
jgi:hypothetical protein